MAVTSFLNVGARCYGQVAPGASVMYGFDHQGSVVQTVDNNGNAQNRYRYHPYGTTESSSEPGPASFYKWIGGFGYRPTGRSYADFFMSRRHYAFAPARWTTRDRFWPSQSAYVYVECNPVRDIDPSGDQLVRNDDIEDEVKETGGGVWPGGSPFGPPTYPVPRPPIIYDPYPPRIYDPSPPGSGPIYSPPGGPIVLEPTNPEPVFCNPYDPAPIHVWDPFPIEPISRNHTCKVRCKSRGDAKYCGQIFTCEATSLSWAAACKLAQSACVVLASVEGKCHPGHCDWIMEGK